MPAPLLARARAARLLALQTYGLTEACSQVTTERPTEADGRTAGPPLPGLEVRIVGPEGDGARAGEGRGHRGPRPHGDGGLPEPPRGHARGAPRWLAAHQGHGDAGRARAADGALAAHGSHRPWRREPLPGGDRDRDRHAPGGAGGRGGGSDGRALGRGAGGLRGAPVRADDARRCSRPGAGARWRASRCPRASCRSTRCLATRWARWSARCFASESWAPERQDSAAGWPHGLVEACRRSIDCRW